MDELKFVLRCFGFAALLLLLTQLKTGNATIEHRIEASLTNSRMAEFVNKVADGGVRLIRDGAVLARSTYEDWKNQVPLSEESRTPSAAAPPSRAGKTEQPDSTDGAELADEIY